MERARVNRSQRNPASAILNGEVKAGTAHPCSIGVVDPNDEGGAVMGTIYVGHRQRHDKSVPDERREVIRSRTRGSAPCKELQRYRAGLRRCERILSLLVGAGVRLGVARLTDVEVGRSDREKEQPGQVPLVVDGDSIV